MRKNIYKDYLKRKKIEENFNNIQIKEGNTINKVLSFFYLLITNMVKIIFYIIIIILCSVGATFIVNMLKNMNI